MAPSQSLQGSQKNADEVSIALSWSARKGRGIGSVAIFEDQNRGTSCAEDAEDAGFRQVPEHETYETVSKRHIMMSWQDVLSWQHHARLLILDTEGLMSLEVQSSVGDMEDVASQRCLS
jgi:hypothetical protein